jgi:hypothetical protein
MLGLGPVSALPVSHHAVVGLPAAPTATLPVLSAPTLVWVSGNTYKPQVVATYGVAWTPAALFADDEAGGWYEPGPDTCYTDDGVTAAGENDLVYRMDDLSGNDNHLYQTTEGLRPALRKSGDLWYLDFDGVDDALVFTTSWAISFDAATIFAAMNLDNDENQNYLVGDRTGGGDNRFYFGDGLIAKNVINTFTPSDALSVFTGQWNAAGATMRMDGSLVCTVTNTTEN